VNDVCAVIITGGGNGHQVQACLDGLRAHAGGTALEVIVVDTGSGLAGRYAENCPGVHTIHCPERSNAYAYNRALESTEARYVLFLGPEVELLEGSLRQLVSALDSFPDIALAGVRQVRGDGSLAPSNGRFPSGSHMLAEAIGLARVPGARRFLGELIYSPRDYGLPRTCDWISGSLMLLRVDALSAVGWFDERLFCFEDADLCWRLSRFGWDIAYFPCMTACNRQHDRLRDARREAHSAYARMQLARKHFPFAAAEYRWALALRYALRVGAYTLRGRYLNHRRRAARAALDTVIRGRPPVGPYPIRGLIRR